MLSIKQLIVKLKYVDIIKVFSLNAVSTLIRMLAGLISVKIVASIIGPAGVALLGQLSNISQILLGLANGGINGGITKYVAEYKEDDNEIKKIISNALRITLIFTFIIALCLIVGHRYLSRYILLTEEYGYVFVVFGFTIVLYTLNALLIAILNGFKLFKKYVVVNISGTIIGLIFSVFLVIFFGVPGALINAVTYQSIVFFVTLWMCRKQPWFNRNYFLKKFDRLTCRRFLGFSLMTIVSLSMLPVTQMLLRGYVISQISIIEAGWWEGMSRISAMYLSVITTALTVYYLPRLSEINDKQELRDEVFRCYKVIVPMLLCIIYFIFILRHFIIRTLFTPAFYPMENLFVWQMLGDFFKMCSWLLSYIMVAKAQTKRFVLCEIVFAFTYIGICFLFIDNNGIVGLTQGYMINYLLYLLTMLYLFRDLVFKKYNIK